MKEIKNSMVIYQNKNGKVELHADIEKDTLWATQDQIAQLFMTSKQLVSWHISNIFKQRELRQKTTVKESLTVLKNGRKYLTKFYNLDVIIAVGYRVNSKKATQFRIWATDVLHGYLVKSYVLDNRKLNESNEAIAGLHKAITLMESKKYPGKLKGNVTIKLRKDFKPLD